MATTSEAARLIPKDDETIVRPQKTASSFFLFVPARIGLDVVHCFSGGVKAGSLTVIFALFLVVLTYVMQVSMLYAVGSHLVRRHSEWEQSVFHIPEFGEKMDCAKGDSLCHIIDGQYVCGPKAVQMMGLWDKLDVDGDSVWRRDEAAEPTLRAEMGCHYGLDTVILYNFLLNQLKREKLLTGPGLVHANLTSGTSIHKAYFDWFKGDAIICGYGDEDMCGHVMKKGVFDAPMERPGVSEVITDTRSAWSVCFDLLKSGGRCESMLPSTYRVWRTQTVNHCGEQDFKSVQFENPHDKTDIISFVDVDFRKREEYAETDNWRFLVFLWSILVSFYATLVFELRGTIVLLMWVLHFDDITLHGNHTQGKEQDIEGDVDIDGNVSGISSSHRAMCGLIVLAKFALLGFIGYTGYTFLTSSTNYMNLLFDAVSLVFIIQIDAVLYNTLAGPRAKSLLEGIEPMHVRGKEQGYWLGYDWPLLRFYMERNPHVRDMFWALTVIVFVTLLSFFHYTKELIPIREALECACHVEGAQCFEATHYSKEWWYEYWTEVVPKARADIRRLNGLPPA